jgi:hypothetical protein
MQKGLKPMFGKVNAFATFGVLYAFLLPGVAHAGFAAPSALWPKTELRTCFTHSKELLTATPKFLKIFGPGNVEKFSDLKLADLTPELKILIQKSITESFTDVATKIHFTGWGECGTDASAFDVAIFYVLDGAWKDTDSVAYIAAADVGYLKNNPLYPSPKFNGSQTSVRINESYVLGYRRENISKNFRHLIEKVYGEKDALDLNWKNYGQFLFARDVVHEFAHVTGLMHEHQRSTLAELKSYDVSFRHEVAEDLAEQNSEIKPGIGRSYGKFNPFSTLSYLMPIYENASEKTRLICELLKKPSAEISKDPYFQKLFTALSEDHHKAFNQDSLSSWMCADKSYLDFNPKTLAARKSLLNEEDQELLRQLYTPSPIPHEIVLVSASELRKDIPYLQKLWSKLTTTHW